MAQMVPEKYMDILNEIEKEYPVSNWIVKNIHIWPIMRLYLVKLGEPKSGINTDTSNKSRTGKLVQKSRTGSIVFEDLVKYLIAYLKDFKHNSSPKESSDAVFFTHPTTRVKIIDHWYDRLCDPIIELLEKYDLDSFVLEATDRQDYRIPRYGDSMFIQPQLYYYGIKHRNIRRKISEADINLSGLPELLDHLRKNGISVNIPDIENIIDRVNTIHGLSNYFKKILKRLNPRFGFAPCYYQIDSLAFNLACHDLGIISVEIQHGTQSELHRAYGRWRQIPENGYELLPNIFWCWSENDAHVIEAWNKKVSHWHKPIVGGNPSLKIWQPENNKIQLYYERLIHDLKSPSENSQYILLALQYNREISPWVLQTIQSSPSNWHWWVRLHPAMMQECEQIKTLLKQCRREGVALNLASDLPLQPLLRHTDVVVTEWSSTVEDAEAFGVPSVVTHPSGVQYFKRQIDSGYAIAAYNSGDLKKAIQTQLNRKKIFKTKVEDISEIMEKGMEALLSLKAPPF